MSGRPVSAAALRDAMACLARMPGHVWDRVGGLTQPVGAKRRNTWQQVYRCMNCGSEKVFTCDIYGVADGAAKYHYSDAFLQLQRADPSDTYTLTQQYRRMYIKMETGASPRRRAG